MAYQLPLRRVYSKGRAHNRLRADTTQAVGLLGHNSGETMTENSADILERWANSELQNGEPLTPGTCHRCGNTGPTMPRPCGDKACKSAVCIDLCVGCVGDRILAPYSETAEGAQLTPAVLEAARQRMLSTPFSRDSVASRVMDDLHQRDSGWTPNSYARPPRGYQLPRFTDGDTQFVLDDTVPPGEVRFERGPSFDMVMMDDAATLDEARKITEQTDVLLRGQMAGPSENIEVPAWGDGEDFDWAGTRTHDTRQLPAWPDHYRVRGGECACGFRSAWRPDMDAHIAGDIIENHTEGGDGIPKRWMLCECGESRLCREAAAVAPVRIDFAQLHGPLPSTGPTIRYTYLCDDCCRRRGIR